MNIDLTPEHTARKQGDDKDLHPEVIAAYRYVESVLDFADVPSSKIRGPLWFGWALREAFLAGCSHAAPAALAHPEPEGPTDEELEATARAAELQYSKEHGGIAATTSDGIHAWLQAQRLAGLRAVAARAYFAQPEPEGLTLEELNDLCADHGFVFDDNHGEGLSILSDIVKAVLARWGRPAIKPEGPTDEELLAAQDQAVASFPPIHPEAEPLSAAEYARELEIGRTSCRERV